MDDQRFDLITKILGGSVHRRAGLRGVVAVAVAALSGSQTLTGAAATKSHLRRVSAQGPCGNGGAKANACKKDNDCCTSFCDKKKGRCRCRKLGEPCTISDNCCATFGQPMICQNTICATVGTVPPPPVCPGLEQTCDTAFGTACCPTVNPNVLCAGFFSPTCQDCTQAPTAAGAFCQDPNGNRCCGGSAFCFPGVRFPSGTPDCFTDNMNPCVACTTDASCTDPDFPVCMQIETGAICCPGPPQPAAVCTALCPTG